MNERKDNPQLPSVPKNTRLSKLPQPVKSMLNRFYWLGYDTRDYFAEIVGTFLSNRLRIFFWRMLGVKIGRRTSIHRNCRFYRPSHVTIGDQCVILRDTLMDGRMGLIIGSNVSISENVKFFTLQHDMTSASFVAKGGSILISDYVFIGAGAIILPGVEIRRGAVVAAGAVVTDNVEELAIVGGVPARKIAARPDVLSYELFYRKFLG